MKTVTVEMAQTATGKWYIVPSRGDIATILCNTLNCTFNESTQPELLEKTIDFCFSFGEDPAEVARNLRTFFVANQIRENLTGVGLRELSCQTKKCKFNIAKNFL